MTGQRYGEIWVEINTVERYTEVRVELPSDWDSKTPAEQDQYLEGCFTEFRDELVNGGWKIVEP